MADDRFLHAPQECPNPRRARDTAPNCPTDLVSHAFCPLFYNAARRALIEEMTSDVDW